MNAKQFNLSYDGSSWSGQGSSHYGHGNKHEKNETNTMEVQAVKENMPGNKTKEDKKDMDNEGKK